jgi:hypothetical protein
MSGTVANNLERSSGTIGAAGSGITVDSGDPAIDSNPSGGVGTVWSNSTSGETYICTDATAGANVWTNVGDGTGAIKPIVWYGSRGIWGGGYESGAVNTIEYVTISSTGNTTDFGDGTTGDAADFGDLSGTRERVTGCSNGTRGIWGGGLSITNIIEYSVFATLGNVTDFGDLTLARHDAGACSDTTRGIWGGGDGGSYTVTMDYITMATTGDATDFGDLTTARRAASASSNGTRGVWGGGNTGSESNVIDYITIASTGDAADFGDLSAARRLTGATSGN